MRIIWLPVHQEALGYRRTTEEEGQSNELHGFGIRQTWVTILWFGPSLILPTCQMGTIMLPLYIHTEEWRNYA